MTTEQTHSPATFSVPGISCGHCAAAITEELQQTSGVESIDVDIAAKLVTVTGNASADAVIAAISEEGYDVVQ